MSNDELRRTLLGENTVAEILRHARRSLETKTYPAENGWQPMETAPVDRGIIVFAPGEKDITGWGFDLPDLVCFCEWHPDAGFCVDEIRDPVMWREVPQSKERMINESDFVEGVRERYTESEAQSAGASNTTSPDKTMLRPSPDDLRGEVGAAMADSSRRDLLAAAESDDLRVAKGPGGKRVAEHEGAGSGVRTGDIASESAQGDGVGERT